MIVGDYSIFYYQKKTKANEIGLTFYKLSFDEINMLEGSCNNMHIMYIHINSKLDAEM